MKPCIPAGREHKMAKIQLCLLSLVILFILNIKAENVYYVKPRLPGILDNDTELEALCPDTPCYTFQYYLQHAPVYFTSNARLQFLPGIHTLDLDIDPGESHCVIIQNISNFTLAGSETFLPQSDSGDMMVPESIIKCETRVGFGFQNVKSLSIKYLTIYDCSCWPFVTTPIAFTLGFFDVFNANLSHVIVYRSSGHAIHSINMLGISSIANTIVLDSHDTEDYRGGNAALFFYPTEDDCLQFGNNTVNLTVTSSSFIGGRVSQALSAPGLQINIENPCSDSYIYLKDSLFRNNYHNNWNNNAPEYHLRGIPGANLVIAIAEKENTSNNIFVSGCTFRNGFGYQGGGIQVIIIPGPEPDHCLHERTPTNLVYITNTSMFSNTAYWSGGGLHASFGTLSGSCHQNHLRLRESVFDKNSAFVGGHARVVNSNSYAQFLVEIQGCIFRDGTGVNMGGGLYLSLATSVLGTFLTSNLEPQSVQNVSDHISIMHTQFNGNIAGTGGGTVISTQQRPVLQHHSNAVKQRTIKFVNCTYHNNSASRGSALTFVNLEPIQPVSIQYLYDVMFVNVSVMDNKYWYNGQPCSDSACGFKAVFLSGVKNATFINSHFHDNPIGAIQLYNSNLFLGGNITFQNNTSLVGAGIELCPGSFIYIKENAHIQFIDNHARHAGGAIYVRESECSTAGKGSVKCFFNLDPSNNRFTSNLTAHITFVNNTAVNAGSALYGGGVDSCFPKIELQQYITMAALAIIESPSEYFLYGIDSYTSNSSQLFDLLFDYQSGLSVISSDPLGVCLCENNLPHCEISSWNISLHPGETFTILAVAVGQRNGVVPGVVVAEFTNTSGIHTQEPIDSFQKSQVVGSVCTQLNYTILSNQSHEVVELHVEKPIHINSESPSPILSIILLPCPPGFALRGSYPKFKCDCEDKLFVHQIDCSIDDRTVHRPAHLWIGYHDPEFHNQLQATNTTRLQGVLVHQHCPFDYCRNEEINIKLSYSDEQCAFNHSGILCGACETDLSLALATSRCLECSNTFLALIVVFLLAGMVLVFLLFALNLTISEGTINGMIFYANIVHTNRAIFFPSKTTDFFAVFIAWMNLDLGIEVCFYDGMDMYARTWLQFVFPVYIWSIVLFMIVSSHYSTKAGNIFGRNNSVRVLATLLLLSYTKILRNIITALSFTTLTYPDKSVRFLWLADANVQYLSHKHIPLFLVALVFLLILTLPYTALLLFSQCLRPRSHYKLLSWVRRIKPFLDAHTGPYKDKYHFWTGFLFAVRIVLFMGFSANVLGDSSLNLLLIIIMSMYLLGFKWIASGIYRKSLLDALEASFFLNLGTLSASTLYIGNQSKIKQDIVSGISVGIAFMTFLGIVTYHICHSSYILQTLSRLKDCLSHCCTHNYIRYMGHEYMRTNNTELEELDPAIPAENCDDQNISHENGDSLAQPQPKVSCLRLTFDRNATSGEAVLVEDTEDDNIQN